ncbi:hypothetical protein LT85_1475 [Collimonas arenae]|uniref:Uncharacterized protein n=1 Tax=Collimonas arenae TaxID=279058 RepID=A0A0A1F7D1_9BURK|nr:hypothetical protein LT85_1475 [Collimonas arenae]
MVSEEPGAGRWLAPWPDAEERIAQYCSNVIRAMKRHRR